MNLVEGAAPVDAFVGLGANLGDAAASVRAAIVALGELPQTGLHAASRLYVSPAWGREDQPDFINAVAWLRTALGARELLVQMMSVEREFGRERSAGERWGPRTLDLDLLLYADAVIDEPDLQVPHPWLHQRGFVLLPLLEIAPDLRIPGIGAARDAVSRLQCADIRPLEADNPAP